MKRLAITFSLTISYLLASATGEDSICKKFEHLSYVYAELNGLGKANKYLDSLNSCSATPSSIFSKARMLFKEKKYADALVLFEKYTTEPGIDKDQKASAYNYAGICANNLRDYTKALNNYSLAEENGFSKTIINYNMGIAYLNFGNVDAAIKAYNLVLVLDSKYADAWNNLGIIYEIQGKIDIACSYYATACMVNEENNPTIVFNYGESLFKKNNYDSSLIVLEELLKKHQTYYKANISIATIYNWYAKNPIKGLINARKGIIAFPNDFDANFEYAAALSHNGYNDSAIYYYSIASLLKPSSCEAFANLAVQYELYGYFDKSIENYQKAIGKCPNLANAIHGLSNTYLYMHDFENSLKYNLILYKIGTDFSTKANSLGYAYLNAGHYDSAIKYLKESMIYSYDNFDVPYNNIGLSFIKLNNLDSAKYYLDIAYSINPKNSYNIHNRALYYYKKGNYDSACFNLKKSIELEYNWIIDPLLETMTNEKCKEINLNRVIKLYGYKGDSPEHSDKKFILLIDSLSLNHFENNLQPNNDLNKKEIKEDIGQKAMQASNFVLYPNHTLGSITISNVSAVSEPYSVDIYNFNGQKVLSSGTNTGSTKINLSTLAKGIYVAIVLQNNNVVHSEKVVVE